MFSRHMDYLHNYLSRANRKANTQLPPPPPPPSPVRTELNGLKPLDLDKLDMVNKVKNGDSWYSS